MSEKEDLFIDNGSPIVGKEPLDNGDCSAPQLPAAVLSIAHWDLLP